LKEVLAYVSKTNLLDSLPEIQELLETSYRGYESWCQSYQTLMDSLISEQNATLLWSYKPTFYQLMTPRLFCSWWMVTLWSILMTIAYSIWGPYDLELFDILIWIFVVFIFCLLALFITLGIIKNWRAFYAITSKGLILIHSGFGTQKTFVPFTQVFPLRTVYDKRGNGDIFTLSLANYTILRNIPNLKIIETFLYQAALRNAAAQQSV